MLGGVREEKAGSGGREEGRKESEWRNKKKKRGARETAKVILYCVLSVLTVTISHMPWLPSPQLWEVEQGLRWVSESGKRSRREGEQGGEHITANTNVWRRETLKGTIEKGCRGLVTKNNLSNVKCYFLLSVFSTKHSQCEDGGRTHQWNRFFCITLSMTVCVFTKPKKRLLIRAITVK